MAKKAKKKKKKAKKRTPLQNGNNGRKKNGQFAKGHKYSVGHTNPFAKQRELWKSAIAECVTKQDVIDVFKKLKEKAKTGNMSATKEFLDRVLGKPTQEHEIGEKTLFTLADIAAQMRVNGSNGH